MAQLSNLQEFIKRRKAEETISDESEQRRLLDTVLRRAPTEPQVSNAGQFKQPDQGFTAGGQSQPAFDQGRATLRDQGYPTANEPPRVTIPQSPYNALERLPGFQKPPLSPNNDPQPQTITPRRPQLLVKEQPAQGGNQNPQPSEIYKSLQNPIVEGKAPPSPRSLPQIDVGPAAPPPSTSVRPRYAERPSENPYLDRGQPFGSSGEPFGSTRERRTQPRDYVADDVAYARELERKKTPRWKNIVSGIIQGTAALDHNEPKVPVDISGHTRRLNDVYSRLQTELGVQGEQAKINQMTAEAYSKLQKPPADSTRIVDEGEYPNVPAGTEIRQMWNGREYVDVNRNGKPVVSKSPPAERAAAREIKYNRQGLALLVSKDGSGKSSPIFEPDGVTPLTKARNESGNVQTGYRLEPDGITQVQIERDEDSGDWKDSLGPNKKPIVRGRVGRIDPVTGAPTSTLITDSRLTNKENQENQRKRRSYESEAGEWGSKETAFRRNKTTEDQAIQAKSDRLQALYQEEPGGTILNRGGRSKQEIETEKARLTKELDVHRQRADEFQKNADDAASKATEARRNAGLYADSSGSQGAVGRRPARDGKHHYTKADIRAQAESSGVSYEDLYGKLKSDKRVVIDE